MTEHAGVRIGSLIWDCWGGNYADSHFSRTHAHLRSFMNDHFRRRIDSEAQNIKEICSFQIFIYGKPNDFSTSHCTDLSVCLLQNKISLQAIEAW